MDIAMLLIILGGAYWVMTSGVLNQLTVPQTPAAGDETTPTTPTTGGTPTTGTPTTGGTTTTPTTTGNPILDALNNLLSGNQGGINTIPSTTNPNNIPYQPLPVYPQQPMYGGGNPAECSSRYNGKCDTECRSGNQSLCNACMIACGGAAIGAVNVLPSQGGLNPSLCKSKYNGKCNTECSSGSSSQCAACKAACGSYGAYAYYVKTPQSLMTTAVFGNDNHSYYSNWRIAVQNAR